MKIAIQLARSVHHLRSTGFRDYPGGGRLQRRSKGIHDDVLGYVERIKVQDGKVVENRIFFHRAQFESKLGKSLEL
jgi:hypothetical protein